MYYDIFNGDADGICALIQLRLAEPRDSVLVTGIKRDIQLLDKIKVDPGDSLTVLDISFEKNCGKVEEFLAIGANIFYADHHRSGEIPCHPQLTALIDTDNSVCTSLIVNKYLGGKYPLWAVTAAFGDNLTGSAEALAATLTISKNELALLNKLGVYLNYNGYGSSLADLHFSPDALYRDLVPFSSPLSFISAKPEVFGKLEDAYWEDMAKAAKLTPEFQDNRVAVYVLPDTAWARRVGGVYGNELANRNPAKAHAVLSPNTQGGYVVSVRAPLANKVGADEFCSRFPTGGGRKSAAGINHLPQSQLENFEEKFAAFYSGTRDLA